MDIVLYSAPSCTKCSTIKVLLGNLKVCYAETNIFMLTQAEIMDLGLRQIPSLMIDGKLVYVGDKKQSELKELLGVV